MINSRNVLYNIVLIVNQVVLCTSECVRTLDLMLIVLYTHTHTHTHTRTHKGTKETLGGVRYIYYLDCGDITGVCICQNSSDCMHYIFAIHCISILPQ